MAIDPAEQRARFGQQGYSRHLGIEFDHVEEGFARLRMPVGEHHLQSVLTVHGGIVATIADAAAAQALHTVLDEGELFSSIELKINYLSPTRSGDTLVGEGRIIRRGGRIAVADMEVREEASNRLVAKGLHTFIITQTASAKDGAPK